MSELVRKEIHDIFETTNPTKDQIGKHERCGKELSDKCNATFVYVCSDLMSRIIKIVKTKKMDEKKK